MKKKTEKTELQQKYRLSTIYDIDVVAMERRIRRLEKEVKELKRRLK